MNEFPCSKLSRFLNQLQPHLANFKERLNNNPDRKEINELASEKVLISEILKTFKEQNMTVESAIRNIDNVENWQTLISNLVLDKRAQELIEKQRYLLTKLIQVIFMGFPIINSTKEEIDRFYQGMRDVELSKFLDEIQGVLKEHMGEKAISKDEIIDSFRTAFVNRLQNTDKSPVVVENRPDDTSSYIGFGHQKGELDIDYAGERLGEGMRGGIIKTKHTKGFAAAQMSGGELYIEGGADGAGMLMNGGKLFVRSYGEKVGYIASGGTIWGRSIDDEGVDRSLGTVFVLNHYAGYGIMKHNGCVITKEFSVRLPESREYGFTLLTDEIENRVEKAEPKGSVFQFNQETQNYQAVDENFPIIKPESTEELSKWKEKGKGLCVVDDITKVGTPTEKMKDGILVIRDDRAVDIGKGMEGGAVIIESKQPIEEVKKRLTWENRTDGTILLRVEDKNNPGKTKLTDPEATYPDFLEESR